MERTQEVVEFEEQFEEAVFEILAVTGVNGFGGSRTGGDKLWNVNLGLTAWKLADGKDISNEPASLVSKADNKYLEMLRESAKNDSIIRASVRKGDKNQFLLVGFPEAAFDADMDLVLQHQVKPVYYNDEVLGNFTLSRMLNCYEGVIGWKQRSVFLAFAKEEEEKMKKSLSAARCLFAEQDDWDERLNTFAQKKLLEQKNRWWQEGEENGKTENILDGNAIVSGIILESIQVESDGSFDFWYNASKLFHGHTLHLTGSLEKGPEDLLLWAYSASDGRSGKDHKTL